MLGLGQIPDYSPNREKVLLKPDKHKKLGRSLLLFGILLFALLHSVHTLSHPAEASAKAIDSAWLGIIVVPIILPFILVGWLPGQGDLSLTRDGFEVRSRWIWGRIKHRWVDVVGFYATNVYAGKVTQEAICYDLTGTTGRYKRGTLSLWDYNGMSKQAIADLLNEWKAYYAPNPDGIELEPVITPAFTTKHYALWIFAIAALLITGVLVYSLFFQLVKPIQLTVKNKSGLEISEIELAAFPDRSKKKIQGFFLPRLVPNNSLNVEVSEIYKGLIRLSYTSQGTKVCGYFERHWCPWNSGDVISILPDGHFSAEIVDCQSKYADGEFDRMLYAECSADDRLSPPSRRFTKELRFKPIMLAYTRRERASNRSYPYITKMQKAIQARWQIPQVPVIPDSTNCTIRFTILRDGLIQNIRVSRSSGNEVFDRQAFKAVQETLRLEPRPTELKGASVDTELTFDYHIKPKPPNKG